MQYLRVKEETTLSRVNKPKKKTKQKKPNKKNQEKTTNCLSGWPTLTSGGAELHRRHRERVDGVGRLDDVLLQIRAGSRGGRDVLRGRVRGVAQPRLG